jgi:3-dehydroquinate dehydratase II
MRHIVILNGPNLNLIGRREPEIYGDIGFDEYIPRLRENFPEMKITFHQTNHEGVLIDYLHRYGFDADGILLNAGGYTHTSIALADAVKAIKSPVVEIHISDIYKREEYRSHSYLKNVCLFSIIGEGLAGYENGIKKLLIHLSI